MAVAAIGSTWEATFRNGVTVMLERWSGLRFAVEQQFGGADSKEKHEWLKEVTAQYMLDNDDIDKDELEEYIIVILDQEFDTILEDGSTAKVAADICELFRLCSTKQLEAAKDFIGKFDNSKKKHQRCHGDDGSTDITSKGSVTIAMEQLSVSNKLSTDHIDQPMNSKSYHSNSDSTINSSTLPVVTNSDDGSHDDEGWEVVKRKKR